MKDLITRMKHDIEGEEYNQGVLDTLRPILDRYTEERYTKEAMKCLSNTRFAHYYAEDTLKEILLPILQNIYKDCTMQDVENLLNKYYNKRKLYMESMD